MINLWVVFRLKLKHYRGVTRIVRPLGDQSFQPQEEPALSNPRGQVQAFSERRPAEISVEGLDLSRVFPRLRNNFLETFEGRTIPRVTGCDDIRLLAAMKS
jgi:hypothetical protein